MASLLSNDHVDVLEELHEDANFRIVVPTMAILCPTFIALHFSNTFSWYLALGLGLVTVFANAFYVLKSPKIKLGNRLVPMRSDRVDSIRWICNLLITDVPIMILLRPDKIPLFGMWMLLIFSTFFDIYRSKFRWPVTAIGFAGSVGTFVFLYPESYFNDLFFWTVTIGSILMFFSFIEKIWLAEAMRRIGAQEKEQHSALQAERLHRKAILGEHVRTIAHEVSNLTMAINLAVHNTAEINVQAVKRSSEYLQKLSRLILEDVKATPMTRKISFDDLFSDINILLRKHVEMQRITWSVVTEPELLKHTFVERAGSTYFILQNIILNAVEAIQSGPKREVPRRIEIKASRLGEKIHLDITDNGVGMTEDQMKNVLAGSGQTTKIDGHGLGMKLVMQEIARNTMSFQLTSVPNEGTSVKILIPIVNAHQMEAAPAPDDLGSVPAIGELV